MTVSDAQHEDLRRRVSRDEILIRELQGQTGASYPPGGDPGEVLTFVGPGSDDVAWTLGTPGPEGPQGPQGDPGPQGPPGPASLISGIGPPGAGVGVDGAYYIDTQTGRFYGPKAAGAWPPVAFGRLIALAPTYAQLRG